MKRVVREMEFGSSVAQNELFPFAEREFWSPCTRPTRPSILNQQPLTNVFCPMHPEGGSDMQLTFCGTGNPSSLSGIGTRHNL